MAEPDPSPDVSGKQCESTTGRALFSPEDGMPVDHLNFMTEVLADENARKWNALLAPDPVLGPASGCVVGVDRRGKPDGPWRLVWRAITTIDEKARLHPNDGPDRG